MEFGKTQRHVGSCLSQECEWKVNKGRLTEEVSLSSLFFMYYLLNLHKERKKERRKERKKASMIHI